MILDSRVMSFLPALCGICFQLDLTLGVFFFLGMNGELVNQNQDWEIGWDVGDSFGKGSK